MKTAYLAASWARQAEARALRAWFTGDVPNLRIESDWLDQLPGGTGIGERHHAEVDTHQVLRADIHIQLIGDKLTSGGRHSELGHVIAFNWLARWGRMPYPLVAKKILLIKGRIEQKHHDTKPLSLESTIWHDGDDCLPEQVFHNHDGVTIVNSLLKAGHTLREWCQHES